MNTENINTLQKNIINTYKKIGDKRATIIGNVLYTGNEIASEIESETELGIKMVDMLIQLTIDLVSRDKLNAELPNKEKVLPPLPTPPPDRLLIEGQEPPNPRQNG